MIIFKKTTIKKSHHVQMGFLLAIAPKIYITPSQQKSNGKLCLLINIEWSGNTYIKGKYGSSSKIPPHVSSNFLNVASASDARGSRAAWFKVTFTLMTSRINLHTSVKCQQMADLLPGDREEWTLRERPLLFCGITFKLFRSFKSMII